MTGPRRLPSLAAIAVLLAAGGVADRQGRSAGPRERGGARLEVPAAAPASTLSSAWFCAGATASAGGAADGTVVIANAGGRRLAATVTVIPTQGEARRTSVEVAAAGRASVRLADQVAAPYASAMVELNGGDAVVELAATGPLGESVTPCASSASPTWYFAEGVTTKDATEVLLAFNPFPEDAVVDVAFSTEEGQVTPQALTGLSVRGQGMAVVNVGDFVQRREAVATRLTARRGRLAVSRLQTFDGTAGRKGMSLSLGAAATGGLWYFPDGLVLDGLAERYQVFNPQRVEAQVELAIALEQGQAEPLRVTVPRESRLTVMANEEGRIPKGVAHAVTARSTNGVGVVVERSVAAGPPSGQAGFAAAPGARLVAPRWALAAGGADDSVDEYLIVHNPGPAAARVSVIVLGDGARTPVSGLQDVEVAAGQRRSLRLADHVRRPALPLVVTSNTGVVVQRTLIRLKGLGLATTAAIPLSR